MFVMILVVELGVMVGAFITGVVVGRRLRKRSP